MSEWEVVPAGSVTSQCKDVVTLERGVEYRTMGVRWYGKGAYDRGTGTTDTIKAKRLFKAHAGDFVFNRIDTQKGAFDVVSDALEGALATNEFPLYRADPERLLADFLLLYFQQASVLRQIDAMRAGSEGRSRWKEADFEAWRVPLPPLAQQRRIVDVVIALDAQIEALVDEADQQQAVLRATLMALQEIADDLPPSTLGEVIDESGGTIKTGPFGTALKAAEYGPVGVPVISTGEVRHGYIAVHPKTPLVGDKVLTRLPGYILEHGDIVFARKGAVDRSAWVKKDEDGYFLGSDGLRVRTGLPLQDSRFVGYLLQTEKVLRWLDLHATGTIMKGLNQKVLARIPLAVPDVATRDGFVARLSAAELLRDSTSGELAHLRMFRSALLTSLLNQDIEIPDSYDDLLEAAS